MNYICSNCRAPCGKNVQIWGSFEIYLLCKCGDEHYHHNEQKEYWINAHPIPEPVDESISVINQLNKFP